MVPVPYRNSKLTHLLKDSLGVNSKTIMLTTVQSTPEYYHQTMVSLKYASRAKKVRNRSLVNRDIIGDSGIHAVSKEIERLKNRLDARSNEFNGLKNIQLRDAKENIELKRRLQEMSHATVAEKEELERQLSHVIHSQAGELVTQKKKISHLQNALQEELSISQNKIAEQEKEIIWLKKALDETSTAALQPMEQLERVQRVADAWQTQVIFCYLVL
jgi:chromosome segregation ATPase